MTRDTTLKPWPRRGTTIESMTAWREHIRQQILWIDRERADVPIYGRIRRVYLEEFLRISVMLSKARITQRQPATKAA